jgi:hypothetical protein
MASGATLVAMGTIGWLAGNVHPGASPTTIAAASIRAQSPSPSLLPTVAPVESQVSPAGTLLPPTVVPEPSPTAAPSPTVGPQPSPTAAPSPTVGPQPSPTAAPSPTVGPQPSPTAAPTFPTASDVEAFLPRLTAAFRGGDAAFLLKTLHPAVLQLYGKPACRSYLSGLQDPTFDIVVQSISGPAPWTYERDGRSAPIDDAFAVHGSVTQAGTTADEVVHVAASGGSLRWFTDCGTPLSS